MKVFLTGASGFIGGSVAHALLAAGHQVTGLVRTEAKGAQLRDLGIAPLIGTLDDRALLIDAARRADAVINCAKADHRPAVEALLEGLAGSGKVLVQTSGSSIVGDLAGGMSSDKIYDEETPLEPLPGRADRVAIDTMIRARTDMRGVIVCPSLIYGAGRGLHKHSMQVPWLIALAQANGVPKHIGPGENIWSNTHIDDLVDLYGLAMERAPVGAFYFAENGENSMREICRAIGLGLGFGDRTADMSLTEGIAAWGEGPATYTMGSNSRVRGKRARAELGWAPHRGSLLDEIEHGCYA